MMDKKERMKKVLDYIIDHKDFEAKVELQKILHEDKRYIAYRELLKKYGMDFKTAIIPEQTYTDLQNILNDFPDKEVKLKILDETWKLIKNENEN